MDIRLTKNGKDRSWNDGATPKKERATEKLIDSPEIRNIQTSLRRSLHFAQFRQAPARCQEFATILNSCGRYEDAETGMRIAADITALKDAEKNRAEHRKNISYALTYVRENHLMRKRRFIQYFDAGDNIRDTVIGIVAGMLLNTDVAKRGLPIIAGGMTESKYGKSDRSLVDRGLNLSEVMPQSSSAVLGRSQR